jgi:ATP-dependent Lhr-like helicase
MSLSSFHPVTAAWFRDALGDPTDVQERAWPLIQRGQHALIAAPTGSGKTLAAFFSIVDELVRRRLEGPLPDALHVLYISPLKALSVDVEKNLRIPLTGIEAGLEAAGLVRHGEIRVQVRTGDTPSSQRAAMMKKPPHILATTPESLYLLLTSDGGRRMLKTVHTVIVDEIHAVVGTKRGSHLALSLERLEALTGRKLVRVGLSATQKPIEEVARFLVPNDECAIIDAGHRRELDLALEIPRSPLTAVMPTEVWNEVYDRLVELIESHRTTLVFVNTRRLAERMAHNLSQRLGSDAVTAHHGSMSKEHRLDAEERLKAGTLRALVATASLELGIDIGAVDLVCQIGSPRTIAAFLQRVGRSGHTVGGLPKGRLFPMSRVDLIECAAIFDSVRRGELDHIVIPGQPLEVLAQQLVAELSCDEYSEDDLFAMVRRAYPYRNLERKHFDELMAMLADGFTTRAGRRRAYVHRDRIHGRARGRRNARLTALVSGGVIPDNFDYDVVLEPQGAFIGTLNEDFAIESMAGDIVQLGNRSWRILGVSGGQVRVEDAGDLVPGMPFWFGEGRGRSDELSHSVSRLSAAIAAQFDDGKTTAEVSSWLVSALGIDAAAAEQLADYLAVARAALGHLPTENTVIMERFFDEVGDMHLVIHAPFGSRINRAWGLALRKCFCRKFNFELQAAATEDAILLSLGPTHSFPLEEVFDYLSPASVRTLLTQALLDAPMFKVRWRWNASTALAVIRRRAGKRVPPQFQRMQAEDLLALVFPDQLACPENLAPGNLEIPDHPLVRQTIGDCLCEAMDVEGLEALLTRMRDGRIECIARDLREPSPLSEDVLNARPYSFLDDAPLEERRVQAVRNRRWLNAAEAEELGILDEAAIAAVREEAWPVVRDKDELHDALMLGGFITETEGRSGDGKISWEPFFEELISSGRATRLHVEAANDVLWLATERSEQVHVAIPESTLLPDVGAARFTVDPGAPEVALREVVRSRLEMLGPATCRRYREQHVLADRGG